jgi:hypothetical protein
MQVLLCGTHLVKLAMPMVAVEGSFSLMFSSTLECLRGSKGCGLQEVYDG